MKKVAILTPIECPFCMATGIIKVPAVDPRKLAIKGMDKEILGDIVRGLRERKMTYREIGNIMGLKGPQSVKHLEQFRTGITLRDKEE